MQMDSQSIMNLVEDNGSKYQKVITGRVMDRPQQRLLTIQEEARVEQNSTSQEEERRPKIIVGCPRFSS